MSWKPGKVLEFRKCFSSPGKVQECSNFSPKVLENYHRSLQIGLTWKLNHKCPPYCARNVRKYMNVAKTSLNGLGI